MKVAVIILALLGFVISACSQIVSEKGIENKAGDLMDKSKYPRFAELANPDGYLNTDHDITIGEYIGKKVILVDFWTYSCINCQRTLPYLTSWDEKYRDEGLLIIGVHTPEFGFEKEYDNVKRAIEKFNIKYPVVQDNEYQTWRAYKNRYWPRKYLIDIDGYIVYDHIGEGAYDETEEKIREVLKERASKERRAPSQRAQRSLGTPSTLPYSGRIKAPHFVHRSSVFLLVILKVPLVKEKQRLSRLLQVGCGC